MKQPFSSLSIRSRFIVMIVLILIGFFIPRLIVFTLIDHVRVGGSLYEEIALFQTSLVTLKRIESDLNFVRAESYRLITTSDQERRKEIHAAIKEADTRIIHSFDSLAGTIPHLKGKGIESLRKTFEQLNTELDASIEATGSIAPLESQARFFEELRTRLAAHSREVENLIQVRKHEVQEKISTMLRYALLFSISILAAVLLVIVSIARSINHSLRSTREYCEVVRSGDLTKPLVPISGDELADLTTSLNDMVSQISKTFIGVSRTVRVMTDVSSNLGTIVSSIHQLGSSQSAAIDETVESLKTLEASIDRVNEGMNILMSTGEDTTTSIQQLSVSIDSVAQTVEQLTRSVDDVSSSIVEMAASIRQVSASVSSLVDVSSVTSSSIFEMDASIRKVLEHAAETASIASSVLSDAEDGRQAVHATMLSMKQIHDASVLTTNVIQSLSGRVENIGTILSVIDEIAEQTNLLALNAAIIASQAGEHGKGFAVVADEVRELSERTSTSTREIGDLIRAVQEETKRAVDAIAASQQTVAEGEMLSARSGQALDKIVSGITEASRRMMQIAVSTEEQGKGSAVIKNAAAEFASMVEQIASATNEQTRTSELIINAAETMRSLTHEVRVATQDQSVFGRTISTSTSTILQQIESIREECFRERTASRQIRETMTKLESTNDLFRNSLAVLNESVDNLSRHAQSMKSELDAYRLNEHPSTDESEHLNEPNRAYLS